MLHKTKVAVGAKTILHAISMLESNPPKTVEMKMGYANNLFALSVKWKTGHNSVFDWSKEIPAWKKICSSTSGSWFNFSLILKKSKLLSYLVLLLMARTPSLQ